MARAIVQKIPTAEHQAQSEPGVLSTTQRTQPLDTKTGHKPPFRTPVFERKQNERGITSRMFLGGHQKPPAQLTIPLPVRSTLAQLINVSRSQISHYISRVRPFGMAPGYPTAHVLTLINTSPRNRTLAPRPGRAGARAGYGIGRGSGRRAQGSGSYYMNSPQRFKKALPVSLTQYEPPTY